MSKSEEGILAFFKVNGLNSVDKVFESISKHL